MVTSGEDGSITGTPPAKLRRIFVPRAELATAAARAPVLDGASFGADGDDFVDLTLLAD